MSVGAYPDYTETGVDWLGPVPSHWDVGALKRIVSLRSGEAITSENITEAGEYPVFGGNGHRGFTSGYTHEGHLALIGRQGALCGNVNYGSGRFWASEHAIVATPSAEVATTWLGELLRAMNLNQYSVAAAQPGLSAEAIGNLRIPVPPLPEQFAIANFLDRETGKIDALVEEQRRLIALLKEKRQAVISHAVTKGLNPNAQIMDSGIKWLGEVPAHWEVRKLTDIARLESGHTPSRQRPDYWIEADCIIPWFTLADVSQLRDGRTPRVKDTSQKISEIGMANSAARLLPSGTVILSRTASVGFAGITEIDLAVSQDFAAWICGGEINAEYLLLLLQAMRPEFARLMMGSTHQTIYMPDIEAFRSPVPPGDEQAAIVVHVMVSLKVLDALNDTAQAGVTLLQERRAALISAAITGKIDVRGLAQSEAVAA